MFHYKVLSKLYRYVGLKFLVNFNLILSDPKVSQNQLKDVQGCIDLGVTILNPFSTFFKKNQNLYFYRKNINDRQLNNKNSDNNFSKLGK